MRNCVSAVLSTALTVSVVAMSVSVSPAQATPSNAVLFSFAGADGAYPSDMTADAAGVLYGTTMNGGSSKNCYRSCGTIFRVVPPAADGMPWVHQVLYSFQGLADGAMPISRPILDSDGNLYGVAPKGGNAPCATGKDGCGGAGVVWELSPPGVQGGDWTYQVLHTFTGQPPVRGGTGTAPMDGYNPIGPLVRDSAGTLYGATQYGGVGPHYPGLVYALSPPAQQAFSDVRSQPWNETVVHAFRGPEGTGGIPLLLTGRQQVLLGFSGAYYSQAHDGDDVLFDIRLGGQLPQLGVRGYFGYYSYGVGVPILDRNHNLFYETFSTVSGPPDGAVVELSPPADGTGAWTANIIHAFSSDSGYGYQPWGSLLPLSTGTLFGSTINAGGAGGVDGSHGHSGAIYRLDPPSGSSTSWTYTELHEFDGSTGADGGRPDGAGPEGALTFGRHHQIYGTTITGGRYGEGTVFMQTWH